MLSKAEIVKIIQEFQLNRKEVVIMGFLLQKSKKQDPNLRFGVTKLPIMETGLTTPFLNILEDELKNMPSSLNQFKMFSEPEDTNTYRIIRKKTLPELAALLDALDLNSDVLPIESFSGVESKSKVYCLKIQTNSDYLILFANLDKIHASNDDIISAEIINGKLTLKLLDMIIFQKSIFAIYYPKAESLLMLNYVSTKLLLDFKTQFTAKCNNILEELIADDIISIPVENDQLLTNQHTNELAVRFYESGKLKPTAEHIQAWNLFYKNTPLEEVEQILLNPQAIPIVKNAKEFANFMYVADNDIVEGVTKRGEFALAISKKILNLKK
ncbi:MAG: hypothetical protein ACW9W4_01240 [Candidatus Nitrosopumilus sp. bin_7KS]